MELGALVRRQRRREGGRLVPVRSPASARNGKPKKLHITGPGTSSRALLHGSFHLGTRLGKAWRERCDALTAHVGGDPSEAQRVLIDQCARLHLLVQFAWAEVLRAGAFEKGEPRPAFDAFRRAAADEREVLRLLGLERKHKPLPKLSDVLEGGDE